MAGELTFEVMDLLCSRLCHDLISPVGAINNGVELIDDLGDDIASEAMGLISQSGRRAAGRLRCFRLCYGGAGGQSTMGSDEVRDIAAGYLDGGKVALDWEVAADWGARPPPLGTVKMLLCLLVLADEALPQDGRIAVRFTDTGGGGTFTITASGTNAGLREHQDVALTGDPGAEILNARTVHAYVTGLFVDRYGMTLNHFQVEQGPLKLQLVLP